MPQTHDTGPSLKLFRSQSGNLSAKVVLPDENFIHLHSLVAPENEANYFQDIDIWADCVVLAGVGLGYHLDGVRSKLASRRLILCVDYFDECIQHTCRTILPESVPVLSLSPAASNVEKRVADALRKREVQTIQVIRHPASNRVEPRFYRSVLDSITHTSLPVLHSRSDVPARSAPPLLLYGRHFLQEELRGALAAEYGEQPVLLHYDDEQRSMRFATVLEKQIAHHKPDMIVSVNMRGFDGEGILAETARRFGIPLVVWFVDDPHPILIPLQPLPCDAITVFCWERSYLPYLQKQGFSSVHYLPLAADPSLFSVSTASRPSIPVGFVGSSMAGAFRTELRNRFLWSPSLEPPAQRTAALLLTHPRDDIRTLIDRAAGECGRELPFSDERNITWFCSYCIHTASMEKRRSMVEAFDHREITLVGDPGGWRSLLKETPVVLPDVDYRTALCRTYGSMSVNLNTTSCQMPTAVNQRVFDIPLSGSFVLSDNQREMSELFDIGSEAIVYDNFDHLRELVSWYKSRESHRHRITDSAIQRILAHHTYRHRVHHIKTMIRGNA